MLFQGILRVMQNVSYGYFFAHAKLKAMKVMANFLYRHLLPVACDVALLLLLPGSLFAQTFKYFGSYDEASETHFVLNEQTNTSTWTALDWLFVKPYSIQMHMEKMVDLNDDFSSSITYVNDSRRQDWMTQPYQAIVDKDGVRMYDSEGHLLSDQPHSAKGQEHYDAISSVISNEISGFLPGFQSISAEMEQSLVTAGWTVQTFPDGKKILSREGLTVSYDPAHLVVETLFFENNELRFTLRQKFKTEVRGATRLEQKTETEHVVLPNGICAEQVTTTTYSNYTFTDNSAGARNSQKNQFSDTASEILPNPVTDVLTIALPDSNGDFNLLIVNIMGETVMQTKGGEQNNLNVSNFPAGIYFLTVAGRDHRETLRFVKK